MIKPKIWSALLVSMFTCNILLAFQTDQMKRDSVNVKTPEHSFINPEKPPYFQGGNDSLHRFIYGQLKYPHKSKILGIQGRITVNFIVQEMGMLTDIKILRSVPNGTELNDEAIRIMSASPSWYPGKIDDRPVRMSYSVPILFSTNETFSNHYFVVDEKPIKLEKRKEIHPEDIIQIEVLNQKEAVARFGKKASYGAVIIHTKK